MSFDFYLARVYAIHLMTVSLIIWTLIYAIDVLEILGSSYSDRLSFLDSLWLSALRVPEKVILVFPMIVLVSSLSFCLSMARHSEFVIARAIGKSMLRSLLGGLCISCALSAGLILWASPFSARLAEEFPKTRAALTGEKEPQLQMTQNGLWFRERVEDRITVLNAKSTRLNGTRLRDVTVLRFAPDGVLEDRITAQDGVVSSDTLFLVNAKKWNFTDAKGNPEQYSKIEPILRLNTALTAKDIQEGRSQAPSLYLWKIPKLIENLRRSGSDTLRYEIHFYAQLALPVTIAAMYLIGAGFAMTSSRSRRQGAAVIAAIASGFLLFFFQRTTQTFGEVGEVPVLLATWAPPLSAICFALAWFLRIEDG